MVLLVMKPITGKFVILKIDWAAAPGNWGGCFIANRQHPFQKKKKIDKELKTHLTYW